MGNRGENSWKHEKEYIYKEFSEESLKDIVDELIKAGLAQLSIFS